MVERCPGGTAKRPRVLSVVRTHIIIFLFSVSRSIGHISFFSLLRSVCRSAFIRLQSKRRPVRSCSGVKPVLATRKSKSFLSCGSRSMRLRNSSLDICPGAQQHDMRLHDGKEPLVA